MTTLANYLNDVSCRRFAYGTTDCATLMADWLVRLGLSDSMADLRGTYSDRKGWRAVSRAERGLLASCRKRFAAVGLVETDKPAAGDVALIMAPVMMRDSSRVVFAPTGAICVDVTRRAFLTSHGLRIRPMRTFAAWKVPHA